MEIADITLALSRGFESFTPKVGSLQILDTSKTSLTLEAKVNFTNPTEYTAHVPYMSINILNNDTVLAQVIARDVDVLTGENLNVVVQAVWDPQTSSGKKGRAIGRELVSQYISGTSVISPPDTTYC